MCGIAGIFNYRETAGIDPTVIRQMAGTMVHRGPDDEGFYLTPRVGLGHRRLSIIDRAGGHQPMANEDSTIWIVFNGEIYNHQELRKELQAKGHTYRTQSDTESIIHAYEEFGDVFELHLTGMFAFALWDEPRGRLVLSRDRLGIKPLYYTVQHGRLIFASEIKAILSVPNIERRVDQESLNTYLSLRYVPGPKTMFKDIFKLQPGHTLVAEKGRIATKCYWDLQFSEHQRQESDVVDELDSLLRDVCRSHLMSEVPYGVFLSGGLDSASVVAVMKGFLAERLTTFTVGYDDDTGVSEFGYARMVSDHIMTAHHDVLLKAQDFADWIPHLVWHLDEPVGDPASIPLFFLARFAKTHATVLHSGEGADEIFAGYYIYKKMEMINKLQASVVSRAVKKLSGSVAVLAGSTKIGHYLRQLEQPLEARYRGVSRYFLNGSKAELIKREAFTDVAAESAVDEIFTRYYGRVSNQRSLNRMLYVDSKTWLPDDLLIKADKMTMAASVELRVPFLDHRLVEFAAGLPVELKLREGETKYVLKKLMERYLPAKVIYRVKQGFPVPIAQWFRNGLSALANEVLLSPGNVSAAYVNQSYIASLLKMHQVGKCDFSNELWGLLVLEYWFRTFRVQA